MASSSVSPLFRSPKAGFHLAGKRSPSSIHIRPTSAHFKFSPIHAQQMTTQASSAIRDEQSALRVKDAVIIVDHGSRRQESNSMLHAFVDMYKEKTCHPIVEAAHMELAKPTIKEAFDSCVNQGATRVIISPYFLSPGRHWNQDIPALAAQAAKEHPGILYIVTAPLGLHELMVSTWCGGSSSTIWGLYFIVEVKLEKTVVADRIKYCLSKVAGDSGECEICLGTGQCQQRTA